MRPDIDPMFTITPLPLCHHHPTEGLSTVPDTVDIGIHDMAPLLRGDLQGRTVDACACIVDQHVDPAEPVNHLLNCPPDVLGFGDVGRHRSRRDAERLQLLDHRCRSGRIAHQEYNIAAGLCQGLRQSAADSSRRAGHHRHPAGQRERIEEQTFTPPPAARHRRARQ